jgi:hypothetical protein
MASKFDHQKDPEVKKLLEKLPAVLHTPLVGAADLAEVVKVFDGLPKLEYPINSAGELIGKLGPAVETLVIAEVKVDPLRIIKYMPAYYFPIASVENFIEKMAELVRQNRKTVNVPKELANIKRQLPEFRFPIANSEQFLKSLAEPGRKYAFQGGAVDPKKILERIPSSFFPVKSQADLENKISELMTTRPLIVKD